MGFASEAKEAKKVEQRRGKARRKNSRKKKKFDSAFSGFNSKGRKAEQNHILTLSWWLRRTEDVTVAGYEEYDSNTLQVWRKKKRPTLCNPNGSWYCSEHLQQQLLHAAKLLLDLPQSGIPSRSFSLSCWVGHIVVPGPSDPSRETMLEAMGLLYQPACVFLWLETAGKAHHERETKCHMKCVWFQHFFSF